jgi:hypothetical protein
MSGMSCRLLAVLMAVSASSAMAASAASATTWHTNKGVAGYSGAFTATSGPLTLSGPTAAMSCTSSTYVGAEGGPSSAGNTWSGVVTGRINVNGCSIGGGQTLTMTCDVTMTVTNYSGPTASPALGGVSTGTEGIACSLVRLGVESCRIRGVAVPFSYTNPTTVGGADGKFAVPAVTRASGVLTISNGTGGSCWVGAGSAGLTAVTESVSSPVPQPIMWQTNP